MIAFLLFYMSKIYFIDSDGVVEGDSGISQSGLDNKTENIEDPHLDSPSLDSSTGVKSGDMLETTPNTTESTNNSSVVGNSNEQVANIQSDGSQTVNSNLSNSNPTKINNDTMSNVRKFNFMV